MDICAKSSSAQPGGRARIPPHQVEENLPCPRFDGTGARRCACGRVSCLDVSELGNAEHHAFIVDSSLGATLQGPQPLLAVMSRSNGIRSMLMRNTRQVACGLQQAERRNCFIHASLHHDAEDVLRRARRHFQLSGGDMLEALPDRALLAFQHVEPHTMGDTTSLL